MQGCLTVVDVHTLRHNHTLFIHKWETYAQRVFLICACKEVREVYIVGKYKAGTFNVYSGSPFEMVLVQSPANLSKFVNPEKVWLGIN